MRKLVALVLLCSFLDPAVPKSRRRKRGAAPSSSQPAATAGPGHGEGVPEQLDAAAARDELHRAAGAALAALEGSPQARAAAGRPGWAATSPPSSFGYTPLHHGALGRSRALVRRLAELGADAAEGARGNGMSPLHLLWDDYLELNRWPRAWLIAAKLQAERRSVSGFDAIEPRVPWSEALEDSPRLRTLFEAVSDGPPGEGLEQDGASLAAAAALRFLPVRLLRAGLHERSAALLDHLLAGSVKNVDGVEAILKQTALHCAATAGNTAGVARLLEAGSRALLTPDLLKRTPAHAAAAHGHEDTVEFLLDAVRQQHGERATDDLLAGMRDRAGFSVDEYRKQHEQYRHVADETSRERAQLPAAPAPRSADAADGGWGGGEADEARLEALGLDGLLHMSPESAAVDVAELPFSATRFLTRHLLSNRPLLLRLGKGRSAPPWFRTMRKAWAREPLLSAVGSRNATVARIPYAAQFDAGEADAEERLAVSDYVAEHMDVPPHGQSTPPYLFERDGLATELAEDVGLGTVPEFLQVPGGMVCRHNAARQWYLGPTGSGAPVHYHKDAWNVAVYGRKRWFLWPPTRGGYSSLPAAEWARQLLQDSADGGNRTRSVHAQPIELTQEAGDMLFVPHMWAHATVNLSPVVGLATELDFCPWHMASKSLG